MIFLGPVPKRGNSDDEEGAEPSECSKCDDCCGYSEWYPDADGTCIGEKLTQYRKPFIESDNCEEEEREADGELDCNCGYSDWEPAEDTVCEGTKFTQTRERTAGDELLCDELEREWVGTKDCGECEYSEWTPDPSSICSGIEFTQTRFVTSGSLETCTNISRQNFGTAQTCSPEYSDCAEAGYVDSLEDCPTGDGEVVTICIDSENCVQKTCYDCSISCNDGTGDPYEVTVTNRVREATHSGSVYSTEYCDYLFFTNSNATPHCTVVVEGSGGIDDYGTIGGVYFDNQTVTPNPDGTYTCSGFTTIPEPVEVAVVDEGYRLRVDWFVVNSPYCGAGVTGNCGLVNVKFKFYWTFN